MPYQPGSRLPGEYASKLGHLAIVKSEWIGALVEAFETAPHAQSDESGTVWTSFNPEGVPPLNRVWAVDGSFVTVRTEREPAREVSFVKTALLSLDRVRLDRIDKEHPHPLLLQEVMSNSAVFHSTVFPLKNIRTKLGSNYDAVRHIIRDSMRIDEAGAFYETLKWIAFQKWEKSPRGSPAFNCPGCHEIITGGVPFDEDEVKCDHCGSIAYLTDMLGFHLDMDEDSAPDSVASAYMLVMEHLMLFTAIRLFWHHSDRNLIGSTLFIKDGPLTLRSQYSKLIPAIRSFF